MQGLTLGRAARVLRRGHGPRGGGRRCAPRREAYEQLGAKVVEVSLPHTEYALATYYLIAPAEASSQPRPLRRRPLRPARQGREGPAASCTRRRRAQGFGAEVKRRIMLGTYALSAGYYDAYYLKAQKVRTLIRRGLRRRPSSRWTRSLSPTSPAPAFKLGEKVDDPLAMYLMDVFTLPCNLAGLPGLSRALRLHRRRACRSGCSSSASPSTRRGCCASPAPSSASTTSRAAPPPL